LSESGKEMFIVLMPSTVAPMAKIGKVALLLS
jgi:hypothetical protein